MQAQAHMQCAYVRMNAHTHIVGRDMTNTVFGSQCEELLRFPFYSRIKTRAIQGTCYCAHVCVCESPFDGLQSRILCLNSLGGSLDIIIQIGIWSNEIYISNL